MTIDVGLSHEAISATSKAKFYNTDLSCLINDDCQQDHLREETSHRKLVIVGNNKYEKASKTGTEERSSCWSDDDDTWIVPGSISTASSSSSNHYNTSDHDDDYDYDNDNFCDNYDDENDVESCCDQAYNSNGDEFTEFISKSISNKVNRDIPIRLQQYYWQAENQHETSTVDDTTRKQNVTTPTTTTTSKIQIMLSFYSDFITKTKNQEILLKLMQWSLWLLGACIVPIFPNSNVPNWTQKLSYDVCYARYVTRLLGLPVALEGAMSGSWAITSYYSKSQSLDNMYHIIGQILAYSMVAYYPAEHVAFFLWMNPNAEAVLNFPAEVWFYISMRCWLVYLVAETIQYVLKYNELLECKITMQQSKKVDSVRNNIVSYNSSEMRHQPSPRRQQISARKNSTSDVEFYDEDMSSPLHYNMDQTDTDDSTTCEITPTELNDEIYDVVLLLIRNMFYLFPCIHWSMSNWDTEPWLPDIATNGLMWMEAILCLYQAIYNAN